MAGGNEDTSHEGGGEGEKLTKTQSQAYSKVTTP